MILIPVLLVLVAVCKSSSYSFNVYPLLSRRDVISNAVATAPILLYPSVSLSLEDQTQSRNVLLDLPPQKPDTVRVFLCRHGQTEYNRLKILQGSRIDAPLNDKGRLMAARLGKEFASLNQSLSKGWNDKSTGLSKVFFHSNLQRSKETASIASEALNRSEQAVQLSLLESLAEVDFGPSCDGKTQTYSVRSSIYRNYANWAMGHVDATNMCSDENRESSLDPGETGRVVLQRAATALTSLMRQAQEQNSGSIVAVSHSVFIRTLLSLAMDMPLLEVASIPQANCCINVLDLDPSKSPTRLSKKSHLFIGGSGPPDFNLEIPHVDVIRINEKRHLTGLL